MVSLPDEGSPAVALGNSVCRLLEVIEAENSALRELRMISHAGFTERKTHALRELLAARRLLSGKELPEAGRTDLGKLGLALDENARLLKRHITAVGEISDIIVSALREADSDGTYSRRSVPARGL